MLNSNPCLSGSYAPSPPGGVKCHFPMCAVAYPAGLRASAIVRSFRGGYIGQSRTENFAQGQLCPAIQSVMSRRAGYFPVKIAALDGEQTVQAESACVKRIPDDASLSIFGVR